MYFCNQLQRSGDPLNGFYSERPNSYLSHVSTDPWNWLPHFSYLVIFKNRSVLPTASHYRNQWRFHISLAARKRHPLCVLCCGLGLWAHDYDVVSRRLNSCPSQKCKKKIKINSRAVLPPQTQKKLQSTLYTVYAVPYLVV